MDQLRAGIAVRLDQGDWVGATVGHLLVVTAAQPHRLDAEHIDGRGDGEGLRAGVISC